MADVELRRAVEFATPEDAETYVRKIDARMDTPRCGCPEHGRNLRADGARLPPCTCTSDRGSGVDPACPWATVSWVDYRKHPTEERYAVLVEDESRRVADAGDLAGERAWDVAFDAAQPVRAEPSAAIEDERER